MMNMTKHELLKLLLNLTIFKTGNGESGNGEWAGESLKRGIFKSGNL